MKLLKSSLKLVGLVTAFDGAEMNVSLMPSEVDVDELVVVAVEREEAMVNKSFMPPGINDDELVLYAAVERDEPAMIVYVEVAVREDASLQLVDGITDHDA